MTDAAILAAAFAAAARRRAADIGDDPEPCGHCDSASHGTSTCPERYCPCRHYCHPVVCMAVLEDGAERCPECITLDCEA